MKRDQLDPDHGCLAGEEGKIVVGAKQLRKAVCAGRAMRVYLARNADPELLAPLEQLCAEHGISVTWVASMAELGRECGIEVGAAAAAMVRNP